MKLKPHDDLRILIGKQGCTSCGLVIEEATPTVFWMFASGDLHFHPECAVRFALHLLKDGYEAEGLGQ